MSDGAGWARRSHDVVWIEGRDAAAFADGQLSQNIVGMGPGEVRRSLLLEPRGKLRGVLWVLAGEGRIGLVTWAGTGAAIAEALERFRFRVAAEITLDGGAADSLWGPGDPGIAPGSWRGDRSALWAAMPPGCVPRALAVDPPADGAATLSAAEVVLQRVNAGEPVFGVDLDEDTIPHETGMVTEAVSFTKGCYLGQELVSRIETRGHVNRVMRRVSIRQGLPPSGAAVHVGDTALGRLGSVAAVGDGAAALALLRREAAPGDAVVIRWDSGEAAGEVVDILRSGG